jgi:PAS domain S-box-containing protein
VVKAVHHIPIWILDSSAQRIIGANEAAAELFGYSSQELLVLNTVDVLDASEHERFRRFSARARHHWGDGGSWLCRAKNGACFQVTVRFHGIMQGSDIALFMFSTAVSGHPTFRQPGTRAAQAG